MTNQGRRARLSGSSRGALASSAPPQLPRRRDHRIAFLVLSVAGLSILGSMILVTLKRGAFTATIERVRARLRGWE